MILFYSTYCPYCSMLLDTVKRSDHKGMVKLVCIEVLRSKGERVPIESVPTLITLPDRRVLTGKAVFDYLLLPGKGKLLTPINKAAESGAHATVGGPGPSSDDPMAFSMGSLGFGESFTDINHEGSTASDCGSDDRSFQWTPISNQEQTPLAISNFTPEETRSKKPSVDLETFKMKRDMDLQQSEMNMGMVSPPSFTR